MGAYSDYLNRNFSFEQLTAERKKQLRRISQLRGGRDVLVYAADLGNPQKSNAPIMLGYADLLPISDQLSNLNGDQIDLILETPGGSGEVAEDLVRLLHGKYKHVAVMVPGYAKSAGTIIAMAGDEILMEPASALGPIDAQIFWQGKVFSADALIEGFEKIKEEVTKSNTLNKAYIPILQSISPGELQSAQNALNFAKVLVTEWLTNFKFKDWDTHSSTGKPVTNEERRARAEEIAGKLCDHRRWLTHGRSLKISDLEEMKLRITDYSGNADLADAIRRYHTLIQMTFQTNIYKVIETVDSQIYRFIAQQIGPPSPQNVNAPAEAAMAEFAIDCPNCHAVSNIQANLGAPQPIQPGRIPFPANNKLPCPSCGTVIDLSDARRQLEAQARKPIIA